MKFELALEAVNNLYRCLKRLSTNPKVLRILDRHEDLSPLNDFPIDFLDRRIASLCIVDAIKCFENLGHSFDIHRDESKILALLIIRITTPKERNLWDNEAGYGLLTGMGLADTAFHAFYDNVKVGYAPDRLLLVDILRGEGAPDDLVNSLVISLFRLLLVIAEADRRVTPAEKRWLGELVSFSTDSNHRKEAENRVKGLVIPPENTSPDDEWCIITEAEEEDVEDDDDDDDDEDDENDENDEDDVDDVDDEDERPPLERLEDLVGLDNVKHEVQNIYNLVKIASLRKTKGMKSADISYHCVFTGNPGTGKTTVARIVADIYKELGILKKGHLVETDRSGLIGEYVGHTAVKTNKIIDSAIDGVLFIDEAYTLATGSQNDYGPEAIATLLKRMEDDRRRLVVIIAGYSDEMKQFIDSNPGLQSRFNRYIHFDDYSIPELLKIFRRSADKFQYRLDEEAETRLREVITAAVVTKNRRFGNARYVRNLFEKTIENQARRLVTSNDIDETLLSEIRAEDIPEG